MTAGASTRSTDQEVVVCGGGVIGASIAYYLAKRGQKCTVIDREEVAAAASGRAGGFLALDWNDTTPVGRLARVSYALHGGLEQELGCSLDYRKLDTFSVEAMEQGGLVHGGRGHKKLPKWVDGHIGAVARLGDPSTTAQVHPRKLTEAFMARATALAGSRFIKGTVKGIATVADGGGRVTGVELAEGTQAADVVVIAMGPWSSLASAWLPLPMVVSGQKYHSVVVRAPEATATALFTSVRKSAGAQRKELEIYPRPHGQVYLCGEADGTPVPARPSDITVHEDACDRLIASCSIAASGLRGAEVLARQACYLPLSADGLPVLGAVAGVPGAFVATGHSCWGILNAPATGLAMSELILDGKAQCVDLSPFSPERFLR